MTDERHLMLGGTAARLVIVTAAATGMTGLGTGTASANLIGVGNAAFGNVCKTYSETVQAAGATAHSSGVLNGNGLQVPLDASYNRCGVSDVSVDLGSLPVI
ncbi:chaplin family protein [Streptomyces lavendofoliae]|uniref:chaplin family protein n=1 Tax=Streptomyces lavendofoliae TaxID=67314 RepID=UPI003D930436